MTLIRNIFKAALCASVSMGAISAHAGPQPGSESVKISPYPMPKPDRPPVVAPANRDAHYIQVALLLDTSNSMDGLINQAKSQLWSLVNELAEARRDGHAPHLELALYEYGNNKLSIANGYIRQVLPLTSDLDSVSEALFELTTSGGSEHAGQVIDTALKELEWSKFDQDLKLIIIAGNEPFTQGPVSYRTACDHARRGGVTIDTIHCGNSNQGIRGKWKDGAECSGGIYMTIDQDAKSVHIDSPYDDEILDLNRRLNSTYMGYGAMGAQKAARQVAQDSNASSYSKKSAMERVKSKSSSLYKNDSWDVVDGYAASPEAIISMDEADLPDAMKGMDAEARKAYIEEKAAERVTVRAQIKALEKKRERFVAEKRKDMADTKTLDNVMVDAVKRQAKGKGFDFGKTQ